MSILGKIMVKLGWDNSEFKKGVSEAEKTTTTFTEKLKNLGSAVGVAFGIGAVFSFGKKVVQVRGEFESLEIAFRTLLKSKEKADALMAQMVDTAARTPFSLQEVATGAKQLLAYGFAAEEVNGTLIQLGNVAAGLGLPMERLTYLYGTTRTQGRLFARDLMQFTTSGIPLLQELANMFGKSTEEVNKMVSAAEIGFDEVKQAFANMTGEAGMFYNLMENRSKGISGKISNLGDAISVMFNKIGESNEGVIHTALDSAKYLVGNYEEVWRILKTLIATYGTYKAVLIAVAAAQKTTATIEAIIFVNTLTKSIKGATLAQKALSVVAAINPWTALAAGASALVGAFILFGKEAKTTEEIISDLDKSTQNFIENKGKIEALASEYEVLSTTTNRTKEENDRLNKVMKLLSETVPNAAEKFDEYGNILEINTKKVKEFGTAQRNNLRIEANVKLSDAIVRLAEINEKLEEYNNITQKGSFTRQKQIFVGGQAITTQDTETVKYSQEAINVSAIEANKLASEKVELTKSISNAQSLLLAIERAETKETEKQVDTTTDIADIVKNIKKDKAEIAILDAKPKKTETELANLKSLRTQLEDNKASYKEFTGKEWDVKVNVETDKDQLNKAAENSVAYLENKLSEKQLAVKLEVDDVKRADLLKQIESTEAEIKIKMELLDPKTERQTLEDAIKQYEDMQLAIPVGLGTPEEIATAQAEWDRLQSVIKQAREELDKFPKDLEIAPPEGSVAAYDKQLQQLSTDYANATTETERYNIAKEQLLAQMARDYTAGDNEIAQLERRVQIMGELAAKYAGIIPLLSSYYAGLQQIAQGELNVAEKGKVATEGVIDLGAQLQTQLGGAMAESISSMFEGLFSGNEEQTAQEKTQAILEPFAKMITQLGQYCIAMGVAGIAMKQLIKDPYLAIAAGVALVALGQLAQAGVNNITNGNGESSNKSSNTFTGGYSSGASNTASVNQMQFASPQPQIIVLDTRVSGSDIVFVANKEQQRRKR